MERRRIGEMAMLLPLRVTQSASAESLYTFTPNPLETAIEILLFCILPVMRPEIVFSDGSRVPFVWLDSRA